MIRVIIVEDEPATARGLSLLISQNRPHFEVIAVARNGKEGLRRILDLKPDLVFIDISMPVMNGLDMIKEMQNAGFFTHCVILTGYAEFEYAQKAIQLGVADYLLKPVSPDTLEEIMSSFEKKLQTELRILQAEYLQRALSLSSVPSGTENPLMGYTCTLLLVLPGPICSNIYHEILMRSDLMTFDAALGKKLEEEYRISLFPLYGHHYNDCIYAVVYPNRQTTDIMEIAEKLYPSFLSSETYVNLIISGSTADGQQIHILAREIYFYAVFRNPFGFGAIHTVHSIPDRKIHVSEEIRQICTLISERSQPEEIRDYFRSMLFYWKDQKVTQFQLTYDLRYFIEIFSRNVPADSHVHPDAAEMVFSCRSYDELEKEFLFELEQCFGRSSAVLPDSQQSLAKQVRDWLDTNFTSPITFKIFQDIFGHNEKYISALFKAEFGISPSKYIGELRLNMAKKLIQSNPNLLLKDIAEMVGYNDAFYFSRVFKSHEGISPSQYAKICSCSRPALTS